MLRSLFLRVFFGAKWYKNSTNLSSQKIYNYIFYKYPNTS